MDKTPQPKPVDPKATPQVAQQKQQQPKAVDPKADASPRVFKYSEESPIIRYDYGKE